MKRFILALALLCACATAFSQSTAVAGRKVLDNNGNLLASGQWCFGSTCFTVTSGAFSGSVRSGTQTVTVTGGGNTYLTVPGVTIAGSYFTWDTYAVSSSANISGIGVPRIACVPGAVYSQTDGAQNKWQCISQNGAGTWNGLPNPGTPWTVTVRSTTTLPTGSPATVVNSGTPNAVTLDFGIPTGPTGPTGPQGIPALLGANKGSWGSGTTYNTGDVVSYSGNSYASFVGSNTGNEPDTSPSDWGMLANLSNLPVAFSSQSAANPQPGSFSTVAAGTTATGDEWDPMQPLANWRQAMTNTGSGQVSIVVVGDSVHAGVGPSSWGDTPVMQWRKLLQPWGYGGTGLIPIGYNNGTALNPQWSSSGTWSTVNDLGPYQTGTGAFGSIFVASGSSNTLTLSGAGNGVEIYGETTTNSAGCSVTVDGSSVGTVGSATSGAPTAFRSGFYLPSGSHTLVLAPSGSGACYLYGAAFTNGTTGVIVHNLAHGYARSEAYGASATTQLAFVATMSPLPSLAVISLGINDSINGTGVTQTQYAANLQAIVAALKSINPEISILIDDEQDVESPGTTLTQVQIRATEQSLAQSNGASYMSMHDVWQSFANANALGLMGGDGVHPTNSGGISMGYEEASRIIGKLPTPQTVGALLPSIVPNMQGSMTIDTNGDSSSNVIQPGLNLATFGGGTYINGIYYANIGGGNFTLSVLPSDWSGWKWCTYPAGTTISTWAGLTYCYTLPPPTANSNLPLLPSTVTNMQGSMTIDTNGDSSSNVIQPGLNLATFGGGTYINGIYYANIGGTSFTLNLQPSGWGGWAHCIYPGGTTISTWAGLTYCHTLPPPTANDTIVTAAGSTPADNATCTAGQQWFDASYLYICVASGNVKRLALSAF